ncbi:MAG: hypothetical protein LWW93_08840 [Hyphomicrobiales bacterium]|nr:hypothetical protein [Hyphomicrobiales bacterium]
MRAPRKRGAPDFTPIVKLWRRFTTGDEWFAGMLPVDIDQGVQPMRNLLATAVTTVLVLFAPQIVRAQMDGADGLRNAVAYDHNGSTMAVSFADGVIVYSDPRAGLAGMVRPGDVVFRGKMREEGRIVGTAYVFKRGCAPAPYAVEGREANQTIVLTGSAPIRGKGCEILGRSSSSPNARLVFHSMMSL